ncbi:MAG TPA: hypothetical protein VGF95_04110 [Solirubrobacteraceae bacterium]|jgi:hypothetical protein
MTASNDLPALSGGLFPTKHNRQIARALARIDSGTTLAIRQDRAQIERIAQTTQDGMVAVCQLAGLEASLAQLTPHAAGRIEAVAVAGAIQIVGVVHNAGRSL